MASDKGQKYKVSTILTVRTVMVQGYCVLKCVISVFDMKKILEILRFGMWKMNRKKPDGSAESDHRRSGRRETGHGRVRSHSQAYGQLLDQAQMLDGH